MILAAVGSGRWVRDTLPSRNMFQHFRHFAVDGEVYEFATFYQGLGHRHPSAYSILGGPEHGTHQPTHERPSIEPPRDDWSIEMPVMLWLLDMIRQGAVTAEQVREDLIECSSPPGGCCWGCEEFQEPEEVIIARCAQDRERWFAAWNTPTAESHPYAAMSSLHSWNCRILPELVPPPIITSKHEYVRYRYHRDYAGGRRDPYRRLTTDEAKRWRGRRCKICSPVLPGAWRDETSDVPSTY